MNDDPGDGEPDGYDHRRFGRRPFLSTIGALGAAGLAGPAAARSSVSDPYYAALRDEVRQLGLPTPAFVYAETAAETLDGYQHSGAVNTTAIDPGDDDPFETALRVRTVEETDTAWGALLKNRVADRSLTAGDALLGVAYLRAPPAENSGEAIIRYLAKGETAPAADMVENAGRVRPGAEWQRHYFRIDFENAAEPGAWWTEFFLGYGPQTVDVGGVALLDFGGAVDADALPGQERDYDYKGRAEGAEWRHRARADRGDPAVPTGRGRPRRGR